MDPARLNFIVPLTHTHTHTHPHSLKLAAQWENEMEVLQAERLRDQQRRDILREVESDSIVQTLDAEMKQLIEVGLPYLYTDCL